MKLKRLFSGLLVSLIAIVSVLLCVKVSSAEEKCIKFEFASESNDSTNDISSDLKKLKASITSDNADLISSISNGAKVYTGKNGLKFGSGSAKGQLTFTLSEKYNVKKFVVNAMNYGSDSKSISLSHTGSNFDTVALTTSLADYTFEEDVPMELDTFTISAAETKDNRFYLKSISIYYSDATDYNVTFDANGFDFEDGKGEKITTAVGTETNVTLPTIGDIANTVKGYNLTGWSNGTTTYNPGEQVTVNKNTKFIALYAEDNSETLSVKEAIALYDFLGKKTTKEFKVIGDVKNISGKNIFITDESDSTVEFELYSTSTAITGLNKGDKIIGTGYITKYNSTYEFSSGCTYEKVTAPKPTVAVEFEKVETKASMSFDWQCVDGEYTFSNVCLRFGNLFSANAYDANATYGVLLIQDSDLNGGDFATYLAGKTLAEINADNKIKNVVGSPVKVNAEGVADAAGEYYQFAAVLSDMDEYLTASITAVMYIIVDGEIYYTAERHTSVQELADTYTDDTELMATLDEDVQYALLALSYVK